jgi:hypothetical protein
MENTPDVHWLTVDMLREHLPLVQAGREAFLKLSIATKKTGNKRLQQVVSEGKRSQQLLLIASDRIIGHIASTEYYRASQQNLLSGSTRDDFYQEAVVAFLRTLNDLDPKRLKTSPTNYLYQRMTMYIRRAALASHGTIRIPEIALNRHRKITAIRSRLYSETGFEPTDTGIITASSETHDGLSRFGAVNNAKQAKPVTQDDINGYRAVLNRVGALESLDTPVVNNDSVTSRATIAHPQAPDDYRHIDDIVLAQSLRNVYVSVLDIIDAPSGVKNTILASYGLSPFTDALTERETAHLFNIRPGVVHNIIEGWVTYLRTPGGAFHRYVSSLTPEDINDLGLTIVCKVLGPIPEGLVAGPPSSLTTVPAVWTPGTAIPPLTQTVIYSCTKGCGHSVTTVYLHFNVKPAGFWHCFTCLGLAVLA